VYVLIAEFVALAGASIPTPVIVAVIDSPFPAVATSVALFWVITIDAAALALSSLDAITASSVFNTLVVVDSPVVKYTVEAAEATSLCAAALVTVIVSVCAVEPARAPLRPTVAGVIRTTYVPATEGAVVSFVPKYTLHFDCVTADVPAATVTAAVLEPTVYAPRVRAVFEVASMNDAAVSTSDKRGSAVFPAGALTSDAVTDIESSAVLARNDTVTIDDVAVIVSAVV
jgi:hypothetical protein